MKQKKAGIIQEAHGIYEAAQIAATNAMQQMKMNLKKQSILNITTHYLQIFLIKDNNKSSWKSV